MGELEDRLDPGEERKLTDAAPLGRSRTTMSASELTEYAGSSFAAFNLLEIRIDALDSLGTGMLAALMDASLVVKLSAASSLSRSSHRISTTDLTDFAGALFAGYESLAIRVGTLETAPPGTEMEDRLEDGDEDRLTDAAPLGRSKSKMSNRELSEWAGATAAAYNALEARVSILEGAT